PRIAHNQARMNDREHGANETLGDDPRRSAPPAAARRSTNAGPRDTAISGPAGGARTGALMHGVDERVDDPLAMLEYAPFSCQRIDDQQAGQRGLVIEEPEQRLQPRPDPALPTR